MKGKYFLSYQMVVFLFNEIQKNGEFQIPRFYYSFNTFQRISLSSVMPVPATDDINT